MCHAERRRPPAPQGETDTSVIRPRSADGTGFHAHTVPERGAGASVAILPDARGAHEPYRLPARKFAGSGNTAGVTRHRDRSPDADGFARRGAVADRPDHAADARRHVLAFTRKESA